MTPRQTTHPTPVQLTAFGQGRLADAERASIEDHVASCDSCCQALRKVPVDTLLGLARQAALGETQAVVSGVTPLAPPALPEMPPELADHPRYRIVSLLGAGGMGAVYKAEHRIMERTVALKVINRAFLHGNATAAERFRLEMRAAAKLSHPNVVAAHDADQAGDLHFLVMEYVEGISLARYVEKKGPLSVAHACHFIRQAALGLQHAHERGMVHRDIKPHNLMLTKKGQVKVLDFGLARFASEQSLSAAEPDGLPMPPDDADRTAALTTPGLVLGTPDYIAPEQARSPSGADVRADIYSLGCTLYFLLAGRVPFPGGSAFDKLLAHLNDQPTPLAELRNDVPEELAAVVRKMMAKDAADRYATPGEVAKALTPFTRSEGVSAVEALPVPVPEVLPPESKPKRRRSRKTAAWGRPVVFGGIGLLVLTAALLAAWLGWQALSPVAGPRVLIVVPASGYFTPDFDPVRRVLTEGGARIRVASTARQAQPISFNQPARRGPPLPVDVLLAEANPSDYDAVVFVGGNVGEFDNNADVRRLVTAHLKDGKRVAAICVGIRAVIHTGQIDGRRLARAGALNYFDSRFDWVAQPVVEDGNLITATDPAAAESFARTLRDALTGRR